MKKDFKKISVYLILTLLMLPTIVQFAFAEETIGSNGLAYTAGTWADVFGEHWWTLSLNYIFGNLAKVTPNNTNNAVITIAVWLLILITFGDIFASFSTFSKGVSWGAATLIGIIAANMGFATNIIAWTTGVFAALGAAAVYVGLGGAFLAFIVVNLGISSAGKWIMKRKALQEGSKAEAGGVKLAGRIKGLGAAGKALQEI